MLLAVALGVVAALAGSAFASVGTDQSDYVPGSVVTISGSNDTSGLPGYTQGHAVSVDATADNGLWEQTCSDTVAADGTWSCTVTLSDDPAIAVGSYHYTATSTDANGNPISDTGTFTDIAVQIGSFDNATCNTSTTSFASGTTVCAKATGLGGTYSGSIEWWSPSASSATRTTTFTDASGNYQDRYAPIACGTWTLKVFNSGGTLIDSSTFSVNGCSTTPTPDAGGPYTGDEGNDIDLSGSVTNPGTNPHYQWSIDTTGGDTGISCPIINSTSLTTASVNCTDDSNGGTFTVTLSYTDDTHTTAITDTATLTVYNVAPVISAITSPTDYQVFAKGANVSLSASFSDAGTNDTHTCSIDSNYPSSAVAGSVSETAGAGTCTKTYAYGAAGIYEIAVTVTDDDSGSDTAYVNVVVYDPDAGFVTGGGWIDSPAGAYTADPTLTGKATFGFVSKYQKGATIPTGNTEFVFHAAGMNFSSTSYQWLVVAGSLAQFKGYGTINGSGNYGFLLRATDGSPDEFRIKIWDAADDTAIVYDNGDDQPIQGSIVVHTKK